MSATSQTPDEFAERLADALLKLFDVLKRDQDIRFAPVTLLLTGFGTAAAVIGATVALVKLLGI